MELQVINGDSISVSESVFEKEFNESLVHQAVVTHMAGMRSGTKAQKNRAAASGGGAKPWRQKGTGRARAGTIRSPLWRSGGVTFAASPSDYSKKINKKMYAGAMRSIMSELVRQQRLVIVDDDLGMAEPKTRVMVEKLNELAGTSDALVITLEDDVNVSLSARNIPHCEVVSVSGLNPVSLIAHDKVVATRGSVEKIQEWLG